MNEKLNELIKTFFDEFLQPLYVHDFHDFWPISNVLVAFWKDLIDFATVPRNGFLLSWRVTKKPKTLATGPPYSASKNSILKIFHTGTFDIF